MADPLDEDDDKPLDPAVLQVQARLRRLMLIAALTLGFGIFAIFAVIVYRLVLTDGPAPTALPPDSATPTIARAALGVPADARLVASSLDGERLILTYADASGETVIVFHLPTMAVVNRLRITGQ